MSNYWEHKPIKGASQCILMLLGLFENQTEDEKPEHCDTLSCKCNHNN